MLASADQISRALDARLMLSRSSRCGCTKSEIKLMERLKMPQQANKIAHRCDSAAHWEFEHASEPLAARPNSLCRQQFS